MIEGSVAHCHNSNVGTNVLQGLVVSPEFLGSLPFLGFKPKKYITWLYGLIVSIHGLLRDGHIVDVSMSWTWGDFLMAQWSRVSKSNVDGLSLKNQHLSKEKDTMVGSNRVL